MAEKGNTSLFPVSMLFDPPLGLCAQHTVAVWPVGVPGRGLPSTRGLLHNSGQMTGKIPAGHLVKRARSCTMISEGNRAPDFTLHTADDQPVSLTAYSGRPVLLVFLTALPRARGTVVPASR
jgi:hypothetical protein